VQALDYIFQAITGRDIFRVFGKFAPLRKNKSEFDESKLIDDLDWITNDEFRWLWHDKALDWVNQATGECLTGYERHEQTSTIIKSIRK
jgi:hypothetical protein